MNKIRSIRDYKELADILLVSTSLFLKLQISKEITDDTYVFIEKDINKSRYSFNKEA